MTSQLHHGVERGVANPHHLGVGMARTESAAGVEAWSRDYVSLLKLMRCGCVVDECVILVWH